FVSHADELFGPITTIRRESQSIKRIKWSAFRLSERDWVHVNDAKVILEDSNRIQQYFSADSNPTLWRALPALEELQTAWEEKRDDLHYAPYQNAIQDGLDKINKYYSRFDEKLAFVLAIVLHPYYKLDYIKVMWGGEEEQQAERLAGNPDVKNWQDEALQIVEATVR
ncbi:hypothetical protein JOM56_001243, partial [Amanita muscaria]